MYSTSFRLVSSTIRGVAQSLTKASRDSTVSSCEVECCSLSWLLKQPTADWCCAGPVANENRSRYFSASLRKRSSRLSSSGARWATNTTSSMERKEVMFRSSRGDIAGRSERRRNGTTLDGVRG